MSLTVKQALESRAVLSELVNKDKENKYVFSGSTRVDLALNLRKLNPVQDKFKGDNDELIKTLGGPVKDDKGNDKPNEFAVPEGTDEYIVLQAKQKELLDADSGVELKKLAKEALVGNEGDPRSNQLPIDLLAFLFEVGLIAE